MPANNDKLQFEIDLLVAKFKAQADKIVTYVKGIDQKFDEVNNKIGSFTGNLKKANDGLRNLAGFIGVGYGLKAAFDYATKIADKHRDIVSSVKLRNKLLRQNVPDLEKISSKSTFSQEKIADAYFGAQSGQEFNWTDKNIQQILDYALASNKTPEESAATLKPLSDPNQESVGDYRKIIEKGNLLIADENKRYAALRKFDLVMQNYERVIGSGAEKTEVKKYADQLSKIVTDVLKSIKGVDTAMVNENPGYFEYQKAQEKLELSWGPDLVKLQSESLAIVARILDNLNSDKLGATAKSVGYALGSLGLYKLLGPNAKAAVVKAVPQKILSEKIIKSVFGGGRQLAKFNLWAGTAFALYDIVDLLLSDPREDDHAKKRKRDKVTEYMKANPEVSAEYDPGRPFDYSSEEIDKQFEKKFKKIISPLGPNQYGGVAASDTQTGPNKGVQSAFTNVAPPVPQLYGAANQKIVRIEFNAGSIQNTTTINNLAKNITDVLLDNFEDKANNLFVKVINQASNNLNFD